MAKVKNVNIQIIVFRIKDDRLEIVQCGSHYRDKQGDKNLE